ncbi:MAG: hypothetical protein LBF65_02885 [Holosporales bacterium]|jgi:putative ABC transport system permease protein|nr:hypothetical protein [Holosporales bacterium]
MISVQEFLTSIELGLIFGIVAIGIYLTFRVINFADLTCDGSFVLGAAVTAVLIKGGCNPYVALAASFLTGGLAGLLTGFLNIKCRIADLLSGIIVAFIMYSINLRIIGGIPNITIINDITIFSFGNKLLILGLFITGIVAGLIYILSSDLGLRLRAIGYNKHYAAIAGVNINLVTVAGLILSNALIACGGGLFSQYQGFCDISSGVGTLVTGLASVVIGEKILPIRKEAWLVMSCIFGSIIYRIFISMALHSNFLGIRPQDLNLVTGCLIVITMLIKKKGKEWQNVRNA